MRLPDWWEYPAQCEGGHGGGPGRVIVSWHPCEFAAALAEPDKGESGRPLPGAGVHVSLVQAAP